MLNIEKIKNTRQGTYAMPFKALQEILPYADTTGIADAVILAYDYGFVRGQNSIKNQRKRKAPAGAGTPTEAGPTKTN